MIALLMEVCSFAQVLISLNVYNKSEKCKIIPASKAAGRVYQIYCSTEVKQSWENVFGAVCLVCC